MHLAPAALRGVTSFAVVSALTCLLSGAATADRLPLIGSGTTAPGKASSITPQNGLILSVDPASVPCPESATFSDVVGGPNPGTNYNGLLFSGGLIFAERFAGQTLGFIGDFDAVSGTPSNPLALQTGAPGQNLDVFFYTTSNVLAGLGPLGYPDLDAIGEGAIAIFFPSSQSQVSFQLVGGNGGSATLGFYRADGSLIDNVVVSGLGEFTYGFATADGLSSIAGILIQNTDPSGIGVYNVCHSNPVVGTHATTWGDIRRVYR